MRDRRTRERRADSEVVEDEEIEPQGSRPVKERRHEADGDGISLPTPSVPSRRRRRLDRAEGLPTSDQVTHDQVSDVIKASDEKRGTLVNDRIKMAARCLRQARELVSGKIQLGYAMAPGTIFVSIEEVLGMSAPIRESGRVSNIANGLARDIVRHFNGMPGFDAELKASVGDAYHSALGGVLSEGVTVQIDVKTTSRDADLEDETEFVADEYLRPRGYKRED